MTRKRTHGGGGRGQGRKPGTEGKLTARLAIKCTPGELLQWSDKAKAAKVSRSRFVRDAANGR